MPNSQILTKPERITEVKQDTANGASRERWYWLFWQRTSLNTNAKDKEYRAILFLYSLSFHALCCLFSARGHLRLPQAPHPRDRTQPPVPRRGSSCGPSLA